MTKVGTPLYMAPELLDDDEDQMGFGIDVYAFAILVYEIASGKEPFAENGKSISLSKLVTKVMNGERPKFTHVITNKMQNLLTRCWNQSVDKRPSFDDIFNEISSDFSYLDEDVDEDEINEYLKILEEEGANVENSINEAKIEVHNDYNYKQLQMKMENERKCYASMIKKIVENQGEIQNGFDERYGNILHAATSTGNLELVKYIISLDKIDITSKLIIIYILLHSKHHEFIVF